ncbi:hypothetical protein DEIPH_ctg002orf0041 [Deinococcus phoenicis]|uniref:DUF937 domain-containing protein n=1 Tax=Deinococcus phoenicis TaxID=1476583 RepID=A0A016QUG4_9DEIO|nr:DUF937 domain-containing protein [Deinococcus phoenicis]EYB69723.1 hypothetical protein DEIPH_ctg002orf0041 [Deinococcus phoenicis]
MMDIFNMLGGMGQAQQTISSQLGTTPQQTEAALEAAVPLLLSGLTRNAQDPDGAQALAGALDQHDGQALGLFGQGQVPDVQDGQKILGHVFGNQQQAAANAVSRRAGIDPQLALQILSMVAPLVLGYLSHRRQGQAGGQMGGQIGGQMGSQTGGLGGIDMGSILGGILGGGGLGGMLGGSRSQPQAQTQGGGLGGGSVLPGYPQTAGMQNPVGQPGHAGTGQMGNLGGMVGTLNNVLDRDGDGNALNDLIGMFGGRRR